MDVVIAKIDRQFKGASSVSEEHLTDLIQYSLDSNSRQSITCHQLEVIISIARYYIQAVCNSLSEDDVKKLIFTLKLLRNMCAGVLNNQLYIGKELFIKDLKKLFELESKNVALVTCSLQLLGNICVANSYGQELVWNECYPSVFCSLLLWGNENICNTCSMVLYNCIRACPERIQQLIDGSGADVVMMLLMSLRTSQDCSEWIVLLLENLLENASLQTLSILLSHYPQGRIALLKIVLAYSDDIGATNGDKPSFFQSIFTSHYNLLYLMDEYKDVTAKLLKDETILTGIYQSPLTCSSETKELTKMFHSVLNLLAVCSSYTILLEDIQQETSVLQSSLDLLHALSKLDGSLNSARNRSHVSTANQKSFEDHPLFGVKRDIVRLIGNVCYHSSTNQELVHDFIPLLLNQCNIDHFNPYIMQWGIWTIHNICHNNLANQKIVRQLEQRGGVNLKELEEQLDCQVEVDENGKLRLKKRTVSG